MLRESHGFQNSLAYSDNEKLDEPCYLMWPSSLNPLQSFSMWGNE